MIFVSEIDNHIKLRIENLVYNSFSKAERKKWLQSIILLGIVFQTKVNILVSMNFLSVTYGKKKILKKSPICFLRKKFKY